MMMTFQFIAVLRDCFTAGYTFPQYCIDNKINNPIFVTDKKNRLFLWECYVQFCYDKRLKAQFCLIDEPTSEIKFTVYNTIPNLITQTLSKELIDECDKVIVISTDKKLVKSDKAIYLDKISDYFIRKTYCEIPLLHFLQRYPKVKFFLTNFPTYARYKDGVEFNKSLKSLRDMMEIFRNEEPGKIKTSLDKFGYTNQEVYDLIRAPRIEKNPDGTTPLKDTDENSVQRIQNGKRITAGQPETFQNKIYFVGSCHQYGINAPFDKTIETYLQQMLNENNLPYRVENEGQHYYRRHQDVFYNLNALNPEPGDIIFFWVDNPLPDSLPLADVSDAFDSPNDYKRFFAVKGHVNELGYKAVAEKYFKYLKENNFFRDKAFDYPAPPPPPHRYGIPLQLEQAESKLLVTEELRTYKQQLRTKKLPIGALVMNCSPFTLGHRYLVEHAVARVVKLYIFICEEDNSEFPFADRIELVRQGVKDFPNVEVLSGGKFIKTSSQDATVESEGIEIFGREIAPTLGITIRFAGDKPLDNVTRQYNETMKKILPRYGVEFREIPRKTFGGEVISTGRVREALKAGDFDTIKNLVPDTTLKYLRERYSATK